jgi:hypothetical protein
MFELVLAAVAGILFLCIMSDIYYMMADFYLLGKSARRQSSLPSREQGAANAQAQQLLKDLLEEGEYIQLMKRGYLDVASPHQQERTYRIPSTSGMVQVYDQGRLTLRLCLRPCESLPAPDVILLHKLMITGCEDEYLAHANVFPAVMDSTWNPCEALGRYLVNWVGGWRIWQKG